MRQRTHRGEWVLLAFASTLIPLWACGALIGVKDIFGGSDAASEAGLAEGGEKDAAHLPDDASALSDAALADAASDSNDAGNADACGDPLTSAENCGRCGHSCLGGECLQGKCQPVVLRPAISPRDIVLDKTHIYWIEPSAARVMQADKDGKNVVPLAVGGVLNDYPRGLAIDDNAVYWGSNNVVLRCRLGGCANTPTLVANTGAGLASIAIDQTQVYWIEGGSDTAAVMSAPKNGTMGTGTSLYGDPDAGSFYKIAVHTQSIFFTVAEGTVRKIGIDGGAPTIVGSAKGEPVGLAVDDANVYWAVDDDPGTINVAPRSGASRGAPLAAGQQFPLALAVDPTSIYWVNLGPGVGGLEGTLMTCNFASCAAPTIIASKQKGPVAVAIDETAIYWSNFGGGVGDGALMRLARP